MKPMPASRMQAPTCSALSSILTPSACSTSAAPDFDDNARLPCLATGTPAPATINAAQVEMLNEPEASPPVPTTSMALGCSAASKIRGGFVEQLPHQLAECGLRRLHRGPAHTSGPGWRSLQ